MITPSELEALLRGVGWRDIDLGINRPQPVPEVPAAELAALWKRYRPDLWSESASAMCRKL